jgi:hypothetical protein
LNNELNKLHVYDPTVLKRDLKNNLKILNKNVDQLASTRGFIEIEHQLHINPEAI